MINELKAMAIFAEVVRHGSFRKAAQALSLSPSVVSYHISKLEEKMGAALLYRSTRKLTLSEEGKAFHASVIEMLDAANRGIGLLSDNQTQARGKLKISLPTALSFSSLNDKIAAYANAYPDVRLDIEYSDTRNNIIGEGIDLTIRAGELEDSDLLAKKLGTLSRCLVCSPDYFNKQPTPQRLQDLADWRWIKLAQLPDKRTFEHKGEMHSLKFTSRLTVNSVEAILQYCLKGTGLAVLTDDQANPHITSGSLVQVLPEWKVTPLPLYALWPKNVQAGGLVKTLLSFLVQE